MGRNERAAREQSALVAGEGQALPGACYMPHNVPLGPHNVAAAAAAVAAASEGGNARVTVSPGSVQISRPRARHASGAEERIRSEIARVLAVEDEGNEAETESEAVGAEKATESAASTRGCIEGWSKKSRTNMVRRLATLDYEAAFQGRQLAGLTLTLPGDWRSVCPDGRTFKRLVQAFRKRWARRWGEPLDGPWKLEFQARGAPHLHVLTRLPPGGENLPGWVSSAWADVVSHPDPDERARHLAAGTRVDFALGLRVTDPKRAAVYFSKHGAFKGKDYQNHPPENFADVGRFWGYWGIRPATSQVSISEHEADVLARVLRRLQRYRWMRDEEGNRVQVRNRRGAFAGGAGFHVANDGMALAARLGELLALERAPGPRPSIRECLELWDQGYVPDEQAMPEAVRTEAQTLWLQGRLGAAAKLIVPAMRAALG